MVIPQNRFPHVCCFGYHMQFLSLLLMQNVDRHQVMVHIKWHMSIWPSAYKWNIDFEIDIWNIFTMLTGFNIIFINVISSLKFSYPYTNPKISENIKQWCNFGIWCDIWIYCVHFAGSLHFSKTLTKCNKASLMNLNTCTEIYQLVSYSPCSRIMWYTKYLIRITWFLLSFMSYILQSCWDNHEQLREREQ